MAPALIKAPLDRMAKIFGFGDVVLYVSRKAPRKADRKADRSAGA